MSPKFSQRELLEKLCSLPHRGATTNNEKAAANILEKLIMEFGGQSRRESFSTTKSYIYEIWYMLGLLIAGLLLLPVFTFPSLFAITLSVILLFLYFDWRHTPVTLLPPRGQSQNIIANSANRTSTESKKKIILMAHYDTAPVSMLYLPSMVKNFHQSLMINLFNLSLILILSILFTMGITSPVLTWVRYAYIIYFFIQAILTGLDFFRLGYTNGAADNGSGVIAALSLARRLWKQLPDDWCVELVLTGAEEVGMRGANHYFDTYMKALTSQETYLLNFDNVGSGDIKIITETGGITKVRYDNDLVSSAITISRSKSEYSSIRTGSWHTGDFDSIDFNRAGIPSLTLSAQDKNGLIPNLHRPSDTIENVDFATLSLATEFAHDLIMNLIFLKK